MLDPRNLSSHYYRGERRALASQESTHDGGPQLQMPAVRGNSKRVRASTKSRPGDQNVVSGSRARSLIR